MPDFDTQADAALRSFAAAHPEYTIAADQPAYRGGTNRITLGYRGREEVVLKWFCQASRWANELFCLRHFAPTGLVPRLFDTLPDRLIVMERLGGADLMSVPLSDSPDRLLTSRLSDAVG